LTSATAEPETTEAEAKEIQRPRTLPPLAVGQRYFAHYKGDDYTADVIDSEGKPKVVCDKFPDQIFGGLTAVSKAMTGKYAITSATLWKLKTHEEIEADRAAALEARRAERAERAAAKAAEPTEPEPATAEAPAAE
jgi:hypothetical protein